MSALNSYLPPLSQDSNDQDFEYKILGLDALVQKQGPIDCIFIGSSMVHRGINPEVFSDAYKAQTGKDIHCYNFGLLGATESSLSPVAKILLERYKPKLLVYGVTPASLDDRTGTFTGTVILTSPMMRSI